MRDYTRHALPNTSVLSTSSLHHFQLRDIPFVIHLPNLDSFSIFFLMTTLPSPNVPLPPRTLLPSIKPHAMKSKSMGGISQAVLQSTQFQMRAVQCDAERGVEPHSAKKVMWAMTLEAEMIAERQLTEKVGTRTGVQEGKGIEAQEHATYRAHSLDFAVPSMYKKGLSGRGPEPPIIRPLQMIKEEEEVDVSNDKFFAYRGGKFTFKDIAALVGVTSNASNFIRGESFALLHAPSADLIDLHLCIKHDFYLFSNEIVFTPSHQTNDAGFSRISLNAFTICQVITHSADVARRKPILSVGYPTNQPFPVVASPPILIEFPTMERLALWKSAIETAVQIFKDELCASSVSSSPKANFVSGYLYKLKVGHGWGSFKRRYCLLKDNVLYYYSSADDHANRLAPKGELSLRSCYVTVAEKGKYEYPAFQFYCLDKKCDYVFGADSEEIVTKWLDFVKENASYHLRLSLTSEGKISANSTFLVNTRSPSTSFSSVM